MADLPDFGKMIGPLPLGAWLGVVGGGLGLMWYQRQQQAGSSDPVSSGGEDAPVMQYDDVSIPAGVGTGGWVTGSDGTGGTSSVSPDADTNETWARRAVNGLIALGYDPAVSDAALRKYMEGAQLGASEYALVTIALAKYGAPPVLLPAPVFGPPTLPNASGGGTAGKPTTVAKPKPVSKPHVRYYTVKPGDTLTKIAKKYGISYQSIFNANRQGKKRADGSGGILADANHIRIGQRLIIPNN